MILLQLKAAAMLMFSSHSGQERYVNPLTDFGFKRLFGTEPNKALLIDFLNVLLPERHTIRDLSYRNSENIGNTTIDRCLGEHSLAPYDDAGSHRKAIFDIYCKSENGESFIVEIQKAKQNFFKDRSVCYATFPIQEQAQKGIWNYRLSPVYTVGILDFVFDEHKGDDTILHRVELKNQKCEIFYDKLKFIYLELPKFQKTIEQLETQFDKWLFLLKHLPELNDPPKALQESTFSQLFEVAEIANFSPEEQDAYEDSLKYYRDIKNVVDTSKEEGREEGREEEATKLIIRQLTRRFGPLPERILTTIGAISIDALEDLSEDLLDFASLDDLNAWLETHE